MQDLQQHKWSRLDSLMALRINSKTLHVVTESRQAVRSREFNGFHRSIAGNNKAQCVIPKVGENDWSLSKRIARGAAADSKAMSSHSLLVRTGSVTSAHT
jgi:hypothetical protein